MKIKFRLWDYPLGAIEELITCSQLELVLAEKALFIGRGRDSLFEWHHGGKAGWQHAKYPMLTELEPLAPRCLDLTTNWNFLYWEVSAIYRACVNCSGTGSFPHSLLHAHHTQCIKQLFHLEGSRFEPRCQPVFWTTGRVSLAKPKLKAEAMAQW